ncbi:MAG: hypothetical protein KGI54_09420 [Pseudomonadota bacterium]|nr:hypothetical protein [Pseudomonadota bacterium]
MTFSYTRDKPFPTNSPSVDVDAMQTNCNSIASWTNVDHVGLPSASNGGTHQQVTFPDLATVVTPTGSASVLYPSLQSIPAPVNATTQALFQNATSTLMLSCVKAFGTFTTLGGPGSLTFGTKFNVASGTTDGSGLVFTVTLNPNTIASTSTASDTTVIFSANCTSATRVVVSAVSGGAQTVTFTATGNLGNYQISFAVLQN